MNYSNTESGYTLIELLLAVVVGAVILGASYTSYSLIAQQYETLSSKSEIQEMGLPTLNILTRDLRMAGYKALDTSLDSFYGKIDAPVDITDSGDACCDTIRIVYDTDLTTRLRTTYRVATRSNPTRNALFMDRESWDGNVWNSLTSGALVADYVEDFQVVGADFNLDGEPQLIDLSLVIRSKHALAKTYTYQKASYSPGNYTMDITGNFMREEFTATINLRNIRN